MRALGRNPNALVRYRLNKLLLLGSSLIDKESLAEIRPPLDIILKKDVDFFIDLPNRSTLVIYLQKFFHNIF